MSRPVEVRVPGDKSITHRALLFAALADGPSRLSGLLDAADTRSTAAALRKLGVALPDGPLDRMVVEGRGLRGLVAPDGPLDCGNSGTTARLLLGALAGCPFEATLTGDDSLRQRPMRRVTTPLQAWGADYQELEQPDRLPIRARGARPLRSAGVAEARSSAQVKTALLLAGLTGGAAVRVREEGRPRDHTERMLRAMGAPLTVEGEDGGAVVRLEQTDRLAPLDLQVPGDLSSAAFFLALGALRGPVTVPGVGLNPTRAGALEVLERMGAEVVVEERERAAGEPVGDVTVRPGSLRAVRVEAAEVPTLLDEVPVLAALAARAEGESRFEGLAELRVKESDRVRAVVDNLRAIGVEAEEGADHLTVRGTAAPLKGRVDARGDHRIAMAFAVLAAEPGNEIVIGGREAVAISYPTFWDQLDRVNRALEEK